MDESKYTFVGRVIPCDPFVGHVIEPIDGKTPVFVDDEIGGQTVAYCAGDPPQLGARVGIRGQWIRAHGGPTQLQFQIDVRRWEVVAEDYDWLWQTMGLN